MEKKRERDEIPADVDQPAPKKVKLSSVEEVYEKAITGGVKATKDAIEGLEVVRNFLSLEEHDNLITQIDKNPWLLDLKRRVQHYGYKYDYKSKGLDESSKIGDLPKFCEPLIERMIEKGLITERPDQLIINEYTPGQGISPHVDKTDIFADNIISISLGSSAVMSFQRVKQPIKIDLFLERCSLLAMKGKARYDWKHSIPARASDDWNGIKNKRTRRISLTFRKVILKKK
jgi:alkylated DNA repair dioxygenase AlkB